MTKREGSPQILLLAEDDGFRQELYNFLLQAGFDQIRSLENITAVPTATLGDVVLLHWADLSRPFPRWVGDLIRLGSQVAVVLIIRADDRDSLLESVRGLDSLEVVLQENFAEDLPLILSRATE